MLESLKSLRTWVLKELANELDPVFAHLFQQSLDTGEIPNEWLLVTFFPSLRKGIGRLLVIIALCP